ncbi:response regulator transcription factor, partial [Candidatus Neomarinimicrobiota bacterium]
LLNDKNAALREMIRQVEDEKNRIENQILANVSQLIMPILARMRGMDVPLGWKYIDLLEESLNSIVSDFGYKISKKSSTLSPREVEIGNMIRNGLTSKEIARMLNLSVKTIDAHRNNIRKKLGIRNEKVNLNVYLQTL